VTVVVIGLALWALWAFARPAILYPAFAMDTVSITLIELIRGLGTRGQEAKSFVTAVFDGRRNPWDGVSFAEFYAVRDLVGQQTRLVICTIIAGMAGWVIFKMRGHGYARRFSL